jgi:hypothetical protein
MVGAVYRNRYRISATVALCEALCLIMFRRRRTYILNDPRPDTYEHFTILLS